MPTPHDYYRHDSDNPKLHARGNSRHYVEPDWQAHAAGIQLPEISTIGRGPRGDGVFAANFRADGKEFSFDMVSDATGDVIETIGPIPTGQVDVSAVGNLMTVTTNVLGVDGQVHKKDTVIDLPQAEDGARIFLVENSDTPRYKTSSDLYQIPRASLYCYNSQNTHREDEIPEPRVEDLVMFSVYSDEDTMQLEVAYGFFASLDGLDNVLVKAIEYLPTIKGDKGDKGDPGQPGRDGIKVKYCFFGRSWDAQQGPILEPFGSTNLNLPYVATISGYEDTPAGFGKYLTPDFDAPVPDGKDLLGIAASRVWINAGGTYPAFHMVDDAGINIGWADIVSTNDDNVVTVYAMNQWPTRGEIFSAGVLAVFIDHSDEVEPY